MPIIEAFLMWQVIILQRYQSDLITNTKNVWGICETWVQNEKGRLFDKAKSMKWETIPQSYLSNFLHWELMNFGMLSLKLQGRPSKSETDDEASEVGELGESGFKKWI